MALSDVETKWYQNSETGHVWNVNVGSAAEERLIADGYHEIDDGTSKNNNHGHHEERRDLRFDAEAGTTGTIECYRVGV